MVAGSVPILLPAAFVRFSRSTKEGFFVGFLWREDLGGRACLALVKKENLSCTVCEGWGGGAGEED